ncbi:MAG TPA: T9SS type A sorting domain-containing protein, partial [Chitinophagales bacterium]
NCALSRKIPVMHIHGTADSVVGYNGGGLSTIAGLKTVETTVSFWVDTDDCALVSDTTAILDTCLTDSCSAQLIRYRSCASSSEVYFYKITNGGHTWPDGASTSSTYGNTNRDFDASQEIWNFFKRHKKGQDILSVKDVNYLSANIFPNPFSNTLTITFADELPTTISVFDISGKQLFSEEKDAQSPVSTISTTNWATGMYVVHLQNKNGTQVNRVVKE